MSNYVFIVCFANFVGYFIPIFFPSSIRTKKGDYYLLENVICHVLQYLFTSIDETPTWLGVVVFLVCRTAISLVFLWFSKPSEDSILVVAKFDGNLHKPGQPLPLPQPTTSNFIVMDHQEVDWLELPDHILSVVAIKLIRIKDFIRFGAVCHSWQSVYSENRHHMSHNPPLLMLATELNQDDQTRSLYCLANKRVVNSQVHVPHNWHCPGSSYGWLVIVNDDWDITLLNPCLSGNNQIQLPSAKTFAFHPNSGSAVDYDDYLGYVRKIVLSDNPSSNPNYVAMAIYSDLDRIAICKPGDKVWTYCPNINPEYGHISDVVYYEDQFYFINHVGTVFSYDFNHPQPEVLLVAPCFHLQHADKRYLVESFGELLTVFRITQYGNDNHYYTEEFYVFKLDRVGVKWIRMSNLHGYALFLGHNASYSISTVNFPECKPNSIYFTDDCYEVYYNYLQKREVVGCDMGVFNLEDCTFEPHYPTKSKVPLIPPPIWIEPTV